MINWQGWMDELCGKIRTTWPEIVPAGGKGGGILELNEAARANVLRTPEPYAVVEVREVLAGDWGITNSAFEVEVDIHYFTALPQGTGVGTEQIGPIRTKLDALRAACLSPAAFTTATCLDCLGMDWSRNHPGLELFFQKHIQMIGGAVRLQFVIGETIS